MSSNESTPSLSVITVNYQGYKDTCAFLTSWMEHIQSVSYELIVVDNASPTGDWEELNKRFPKDRYPQITLIQSNANNGFAAGNNLGIEIAQGAYLFFLNNDLLITEDHVATLIQRLEASEQVAALSPLILNNDPHHTIQFAGYTPLSSITLRNQAKGVGSTQYGDYPAAPTPYLHGAALLVKKKVVEKVGRMPEFYFLYYEELDWCSQMRQQGYELWYDPAFKVIHKESATTGKESPLKCYYLTRNRLIYTTRFRRGITRVVALLYQLVVVAARNLVVTTYRRETEKRRAYYRGIRDFITYLKEKKE
ncbi:MAG: glycosyltransferase family 2 protein [Phocaeicola sp.]